MFDRSGWDRAIFHHASKRRREVQFDEALRSLVVELINQVRQLLAARKVPPPVADERCSDCSLIETCMPYAVQNFARAAKSNNPFRVDE